VATFPQLVLLGFFIGVAGTFFAVSLPLASRAYPLAHQGLAMGVAGWGNSGAILSVALAPLVAEQMGWHGLFGIMIPVVVLTTVVYGVLAREHDLFRHKRDSQQDFRSLLREENTYWFCLLYSVTFGGFVGFSSYLSIYFFDQYDLSRVEAGWAAAACALAGSFSRPIGGYLADHYGGLRVLFLLLPSLAIGTAVMALLLPFAFALGSVLLVMVGLGLGNGVVFQAVPLWFRGDIGKVSGLIGAAGGIGGFLLPSMLGMLRDFSGTYGTGFAIFAVLCVLVLPVVRKLRTQPIGPNM
jgi:MFS transporter, NNP family, nitrate/nitrite transporter